MIIETTSAGIQLQQEVDIMTEKNNSKPSFPERTEYEVLSETETETELIGIIRNRFSGVKVICHIPKHTEEVTAKMSADITYALVQTVYADQDISCIKSMEILME